MCSKRYHMPGDLRKIARSIQSCPDDIRAEVIMADLLDRNIDASMMYARHEGAFRRNYGLDVYDCYFDAVHDLLGFNLAREGLYDVLPEGLFHEILQFNGLDAEQRQALFSQLREEEAHARKFFMPIDNEFFYPEARIELEVLKMARDPMLPIRNVISDREKIPEKYFLRFSQFLPFTNEIKGNLALTAACLSSILKKEVVAKKLIVEKIMEVDQGNNSDGHPEKTLGETFICGEHITLFQNRWEFTVMLDEASDMAEFTDPEVETFSGWINVFYDYFVPLEIDPVAKITCGDHQPFYLGVSSSAEQDRHQKTNKETYLGYNMSL